jgi:hypothetical protein
MTSLLPRQRILIMFRILVVAFAFLTVSCSLPADEGMWLFNQPPRQLLKDRYGFELTDAWLQRVQRASIRFNNGGSGSFVSPNGLAITNHHIGSDILQKLSTPTRDLFKNGFLARAQAEELKCPDLELNVLEEIVDVTKEVQAAVGANMTTAEAAAARKSVLARLTKDSTEKTGLRSDVVTLYHGGAYHLYRYKKHTDVRLVMAPEHAIAFFGGDTDNFEYPRFNLDICFFRVYENGKPLATPNHLPISPVGAKDDELVFVSGHPGTTNRLETLDRLIHRRDHTLPYTLQMLRHREALLLQYAEKGPEHRRQANRDLYSVANARKALTGQFHGLLDPAILEAKASIERELRPTGSDAPWKRIAEAQKNLAGFERRYFLLERGDAFNSQLFRYARHLVRLADELPKKDGERLPEYRSSGLESLKFQLFAKVEVPRDLERVKLTGSLMFLAENVGGGAALFETILAGRSPSQRAEELVAGSRLDDPAFRKLLFEGGAKAIAEAKDPMIQFARLVDAEARALRQQYDEAEEIQQQASSDIAKVRFERFGTSVAPDATFTLRLAFGVVKGYRVDGVDLPYATQFAGAFAKADEMKNREPFELPRSWLDKRTALDLTTPFNFVSTADTIGGNSGSPVLNRAGEFVGINFDRNRHGLVRNFVYTDEQARHISVHSRAILESLEKIYGAPELLHELRGK